jgi:hypothetical protein
VFFIDSSLTRLGRGCLMEINVGPDAFGRLARRRSSRRDVMLAHKPMPQRTNDVVHSRSDAVMGEQPLAAGPEI